LEGLANVQTAGAPLGRLQFGHFKTVKPGEILGFCQVKVFVFLLASEFCLV
jgi:hypothetical protein